MQQIIDSLTSKKVTDMIDQIEPTFKGAPKLPAGFVDFLVTVSPWLAGIGGVLGVLGGLNTISLGLGMNSSLLYGITQISPAYFLIIGILQIVAGAIALLAFNPLKNKQRAGWVLMFWGMVIAVIESLAGVLLGVSGFGSLIFTAIGVAIGLYILFELKPAYK